MGTCLGADVWYGRRYAFGTRRYAFELNSVTYFAPKFRKRETEKYKNIYKTCHSMVGTGLNPTQQPFFRSPASSVFVSVPLIGEPLTPLKVAQQAPIRHLSFTGKQFDLTYVLTRQSWVSPVQSVHSLVTKTKTKLRPQQNGTRELHSAQLPVASANGQLVCFATLF